MKTLIIFLLYFLVIYTIYYVSVIIQYKKMDKFEKGKQVQYFVKRYNLDFNKIPVKNFILLLCCINSFIMAITLLVITYINNFIMKIMVAFVILFALIFVFYGLIGKYIKYINNKKEGK